MYYIPEVSHCLLHRARLYRRLNVTRLANRESAERAYRGTVRYMPAWPGANFIMVRHNLNAHV